MGFLSPFLFAGLAALAVPLWLHLRRKRRLNPVDFPSLRYLKMAAARMKRQARVEDAALLLLRLLLLALLVTAFARPVLRSRGAWFGAGRSVESVVVIDATASMGWRGDGGTRLDAAKRLAREWISGLDGADAVALWVLTDRLEKPVPVPVVDRGNLFAALDEIRLSEGSSNLAPVFQAACEWADARSAGRKELVVLTDNQPTAWDWPAEGFFSKIWQRSNVSLVVLSPDDVSAANLAVTAVEWDSRSAREGALLNGLAKIVNHGEVPVKDLLECRVGNEVCLRKPVEIAAGGTVEVPLAFTVPPVKGPIFSGEVALAGDALALDDHWWFSLPVDHLMNSLVVDKSGGMGGGMQPSFFLSKALAAGGAGKVQVIGTDAFAKQSTDRFDSLWLTAGAAGESGVWQKALAFAEGGGTLVLFGDTQPEPLPESWPVGAGREVALPPGRMATRLTIPSHPIFAGVWSAASPFPPLPQKIVRECDPSAEAVILATVAGRYPLLVEMPRGKGRVFWLNASADRAWGDLPLFQTYVPLVQQLARAKELSRLTATSCQVGELWPDLAKISSDAAWPAGTHRALRSGVQDAVSSQGVPLWSCAVNIRREESDLRPVAAEKLKLMLPGRLASGSRGIHEWREEIRREVPMWPWFLGAAALVYLIEGWASARAARRRELAAGGIAPSVTGARVRKSLWGRGDA